MLRWQCDVVGTIGLQLHHVSACLPYSGLVFSGAGHWPEMTGRQGHEAKLRYMGASLNKQRCSRLD